MLAQNCDPNPSNFEALRATLARSFDQSSLGDANLHSFPILLDRLQQLKVAFSLAPKADQALEFGVFTGGSIRALATANPEQRFVGFDSFKGLPEPWHRSDDSTYKAGHFALDALPKVPPNVQLVEGFFEDTLDDWLKAHRSEIGFVHIDADLYSAAKFVLDRLTDRLIDGAVIVFDELGDWAESGVYACWADGEWKALSEWLQKTGFFLRVLSRDQRFAAAVQIFKSQPPARKIAEDLKYATALWQNGGREQALTNLNAIVRLKPDWVAAHHRLAVWQTASKQTEDALNTISAIWSQAQKTPDHNHTIDLYRLRAENKFTLQQFDAAFDDICLFRDKRPDHVSGLTLFARIAGKYSRHEAAAETWTAASHLTGNTGYLKHAQSERTMAEIRPEFRNMKFSGLMIQHLIDTRSFKTVLDIGSGTGEQARSLRRQGRDVTELDYGESKYFVARKSPEKVIVGDFVIVDIPDQYDCAIASHVLEHQPNVNAFLAKLHSVVKEGGIVAISVPPMKQNIVGGHLTLWNAGLVLYNLVMAGFDCTRPWIRRYGYNLSVVIEKRSVTPSGLAYDTGDIDRIREFLPEGFSEGFNGDISRYG